MGNPRAEKFSKPTRIRDTSVVWNNIGRLKGHKVSTLTTVTSYFLHRAQRYGTLFRDKIHNGSLTSLDIQYVHMDEKYIDMLRG